MKVRIKDLCNLDLICNECRCGHLNIYGFYQQLRWRLSKVDRLVMPIVHCEECGLAYAKSWEVYEETER